MTAASRPLSARRVVLGCALTLVVTGAVTFACILGVIYARFGGSGGASADCAVVFGASVHQNNAPGPGIERRIDTAVRLYKQGTVHRLFLTGGKGDADHSSEASVMQQLAEREGVPHAAITAEPNAHSTWENLLYVRPLTRGCSSVIGISDRYHLARIELLAAQQGWNDLRTYPADLRPPLAFETASVLREAIAYAYYGLHLTFLRAEPDS